MSCFSSQTHFWIYTFAAPKVYHGQCLALNQTSQNSPREKWSLNLYTSATVGIKCIRGEKNCAPQPGWAESLSSQSRLWPEIVCFFPYFFILLHTMLHIARYSSALETLQIDSPIWIFKFYFLLVFTPSILCSIVSSRCSSLSWNLKVVDTRWAQIGDLEMQAWERGVPKKNVRAIDKQTPSRTNMI